MPLVTLSLRNQISIPIDMRTKLGIKQGQRLRMDFKGGKLQIRPIRSIKDFRGIFKGMDTTIPVEKEKY